MNDQDIQTMIDGRIEIIKRDFEELVKTYDLKDDTVEMGAHCLIKTNKTYDFKYDPKQYMIDAFNAIGWPDPFPRPVLTGKFHKPNLSSEKTAEYRKWAKEENLSILKEDNYIFESVGVNPGQVIEENNAELALELKRRRQQKRFGRLSGSMSPEPKKDKAKSKKSTKKKKSKRDKTVDKTQALILEEMTPEKTLEEAEPEDDGLERVNLVYLSKRYH